MVIRSILFHISFASWTLLIGLAGLPQLLFGAKGARRTAHYWCSGTLWLLRHIAGISYEIRGVNYIPKGPALIASSHQSTFETMAFVVLVDRWVYILKRELTAIPLLGLYLRRANMIIIDRSQGLKALRTIVREGKRRNNDQIIIFPEGTRTKPYDHSKRHQPGVSELYRQLEVPIHPVAVNSGLFWSKGVGRLTPGRIVLEFLPPIEPGLPAREVGHTLEAMVNTNSDRLADEASGPQ
ncbi:MAG: 1-acyl-sn-glycerol-3-phosphate acyltransferase [Pseudomonadota bacterium]